ncbi:MAG: TspO/MBR family protein [Paracoccaceae bacterium]
MDWQIFLTFLGATFAAAATGMIFQPGEWYEGLQKPRWTPPRWAFPVVWTTLYLFMSFAAMRVALLPGSGSALAFWSLQIALNTLWSPVFFGVHRMALGFIIITFLWLAVAAVLVSFWALDFWAGALILPYLVWVTVAAALNFSVWRLNRSA